jgi:uncharacterized protein YbjQ (UPF0145 family)
MPTNKFLWSTGDVPPEYEVISITWAERKTMSEAIDDLQKHAEKQGADGLVAVRFTPVTEVSIQTDGSSYVIRTGAIQVYGDVEGRSTTRWVAYGTLVKLKSDHRLLAALDD